MKWQDILAFCSVLLVFIVLFSKANSFINIDELPSEFDGKNVFYPIGETFRLSFNAFKTSDRETKINLESKEYPYSESWEDSNQNGKYDLGEKFTDSDLNGFWTERLLEFFWEKETLNNMMQPVITPLKNSSASPWKMDYQGSDEGKLIIRLIIVDHRSSNRNNALVTSKKEWTFYCRSVLEKGPKIHSEEVELTYY